MSTTAPGTASRMAERAAEVPIDVDVLVHEIERYLAAQPRTTKQPRSTARVPASAHPLVTKTTQELVDEALRGLAPAPAAAGAPVLAPPPALLRRLPDWALSVPLVRNRFGGGGLQITAAEHLELTALVIERWGWTQGGDRDESGGRCVRGAQFVLLRLGYGDAGTLHRATAHLHEVLAPVGGGDFVGFNDAEGRNKSQVLALLRTAAARARECGR
ncbi:hypothetical protein OK074_2677 [Actinobacteria bacterium OK074]|nr:hypothetical protein OK074_2677 [Actinobacteria bacterium OK074]